MNNLPIRQVAILAGGKGTRLRPLTYSIPKSMVPVRGKPFLEYIIELARENGIEEAVIMCGYLHEHIVKYFDDGREFGIKIMYSIEKEQLGTGPALKLAEHLLDDEFIFLNGDTYLPVSYSHLCSFHKKQSTIGTLAVHPNHDKTIKNNVMVNNDGLILKYRKYVDDPSLNGIDGGLGIFKKKALDFIPNGKEFSFEEIVYPKLTMLHELSGFITYQKFYDIGTEEQLKVFEEFVNDHIQNTF